MDLDSALQRYLANPDVARWLFSTDDINTVSAQALDSCFVYSIGFGHREAGKPRDMHVEDMLIITGTSGTFLLGFLWGLSQPHVFARTPLMLDRKPIARRFAVDLSSQDALEFMEFISFDDGKTIVMFRQFLHTHDHSLPVVACARLHAASQLQETLGPVLMRADVFEAASCPVCAQAGRKCLCSFDSYAPNTLVRKSTFSWNQFSSRFMNKARSGVIKLRMTAYLPGVGEMCIMDDEIPAINILQKGSTEYMALLRRKAVHGLGINVLMPRTDTQVLSQSNENDFLDLHNSYVSRKRVRGLPEEEVDVLQEVDSIELPETLLDLTTSQQLCMNVKQESLSTVGQQPDEFGLISDPFYTLNPNNIDKEIEPLSLGSAVVPKQEVESGDIDSNTLDTQSPETLLMESFLDPNTTMTPPSMTALTAAMTDIERDMFRDIELILSPDGTTDPTDRPTEPVPSVDLLINAKSPPPVHWTSSISSEDSASDPLPRKAKPTRRAKRARVPTNRTQLSAQTASDSNTDKERKHVCNICPSRFKMRGDLLRHVKTVHEGKKMYMCKTCGKSFGHSGHLNRHISSVHLQQRRFKCQYCGFQFFQASHLQSHIGHIHSAKKPFKCKFCGVRVTSEGALKVHMMKAKCAEAVAEESIACPFHGCSSKFASRADLDAHKALVHPSVPNVFTPGNLFHALPS